MNRRKFLKDGCMACLGLAIAPGLLTSCKTMQHTGGELTNDGIKVPIKDFVRETKNGTVFHPYIIVRNETLQYPICVYRFTDTEYTALHMRCSHQGAELQAAGDRLTCPAHGSEFSNRGAVMQGPADNALRNFPVTVMGDELFIDLRKQS